MSPSPSDSVAPAGGETVPAGTASAPAAWFIPGVRGIGAASFLADLGHEIPTALLPSLLTSTLGAPAAALGVIEGIADGLAGAARLAGGALADDPQRRRAVAVGGYSSTAVLSALLGIAGAVWQVGVLRGAAWAARGLRVPARNALLADIVPAGAYGRAYGFERMMDNLGAVGGPLLALLLVSALGVRTAILLSVIPGLLAALAIVYAIRQIARPTVRTHQPVRIKLRPVLRGDLGRSGRASQARRPSSTSPPGCWSPLSPSSSWGGCAPAGRRPGPAPSLRGRRPWRSSRAPAGRRPTTGSN